MVVSLFSTAERPAGALLHYGSSVTAYRTGTAYFLISQTPHFLSIRRMVCTLCTVIGTYRWAPVGCTWYVKHTGMPQTLSPDNVISRKPGVLQAPPRIKNIPSTEATVKRYYRRIYLHCGVQAIRASGSSLRSKLGICVYAY